MTKQATQEKKTLGDKTGKALIRRLTSKPISKAIDDFNSGDTVNVYVKVKEGEKERTQIFKGIVVKIQGSGSARSFTVRKISSGVGVERTFPYRSASLEKVQRLSKGKVRRAKLYYLRKLDGKAARVESDIARKEDASSSSEKTSEQSSKA